MSFIRDGKSTRLFRIAVFSAILILLIYAPASFSDEQESIAALRQMGKAFSSIAQKASPAVVSVRSETIVVRDNSQSQLYDYFFGPQRRRGQRQEREPRTAVTQGSGFLISPDGYILTNNHMVEGTSKIEIELTNSETFVARTIGSDPESDIAVIKIDGKNFPYLEFADSDKLEVGEWVLAIGNPLGLAHTVTAGIVSATGRTGFDLNQIENYIQTDAAINFGNSGGPLLNLDGKVVGINTAIAGSSGNIGIGFAVPVNMANYAYRQIRESGTVERGLLGIQGIETLTPDRAPIYGLDGNTPGVIFSTVMRDSAAYRAGLTHKDVILEIDGIPVSTFLDVLTKISNLKPGTKVVLTLWRSGKRDKVEVELGRRPATAQVEETQQQVRTVSNILGFEVEDMNETTAQYYGYEGQKGVIVIKVDSFSQASQSGITEGTLIKEVNQEPVTNTEEFTRAIENARKRDMSNILLWGNIKGTDRNFFLRLP
ncbi:MAG: Do family serine endopeptidase [Sedimentisphaerales bacterium]